MKFFKCIKCGHATVAEIIKNEKVMFECHACGNISSKAIAIDSKVKVEASTKGELSHFLTAVIVRRPDNKMLVIKRRMYPFKWSLVMGHVQNKETDKEAAQRELMEESGILFKKMKYLGQTTVSDECDLGVKKHKIDVFLTSVPSSQVVVPNHETDEYQWVNTDFFTLQSTTETSDKAKRAIKLFTNKQTR